MSIKVNDSKDPVAEQDSLLVQVDYANQPIPNNRLPKGLYYSFKGRWNNILTLLSADIQKLIAKSTVTWGNISGTLNNQTDLKNALDAKQNLITGIAPYIAKFTDTHELADSRIYESTQTVAIGTTTTDDSATLQLDSTTQGFLVPRMAQSEIIAINTPAEGLQVYNLDINCLCFYDGTDWKKISHSNM